MGIAEQETARGPRARLPRGQGKPRSGGVIASVEFAEHVKQTLSKYGVNKAAELLDVDRGVLVRIAARQSVRRGSLLLAQQNAKTIDLDQVG